MLIKFDQIVRDYGNPKGVIHIGAHLMEERTDYKNQGIENIIWVEANTEIYQNISNNWDPGENELFFNYAIADIDNEEVFLHVTNNGESSSILELGVHKTHHPHIHVTKEVCVKTKRMDSLFLENEIDHSGYDFINLDIQGAELLAIKGFGDLLKDFKYVYTEVNSNELYKGCALIEEIDEWLEKYDFKRVETKMTQFEWGDALYIKKK